MKKQILSLAFILGTSTSAIAAPEAVEWFVGNESRITCDGDGEADGVVLEFADMYGGRAQFKESIGRGGVALRAKLLSLLENEFVSGTTFPVETDEYVKQAVCLTKVIVEGPVAEGFDVRFKKNLAQVEALLAKNRTKMPSAEDAVTNSEISSAYVNDTIEANRGAVAVVLTLFENR
ncbi:MAG: hypothetical protein J7501_13950 [Bdellovibrio sp.]|nr:hypothetical protein [Bdellovibrio sp.]